MSQTFYCNNKLGNLLSHVFFSLMLHLSLLLYSRYLFGYFRMHGSQWQALADAAKARSCYWRFVLLQLSVLRAEILSDEVGGEIAEIEAVLEEAAELVNESEQKNPSYYR